MAAPYEMVVVYDGTLPEETLNKELEDVQSFLESNAQLEKTDAWGKRQLAYEIKKKRTGYYVLYQFAGESAVPAAIEKRFKLDTAVLRYLVVVRDLRKNTNPLPVEEERPESEERERGGRRRGGRPDRGERAETSRKPAEAPAAAAKETADKDESAAPEQKAQQSAEAPASEQDSSKKEEE